MVALGWVLRYKCIRNLSKNRWTNYVSHANYYDFMCYTVLRREIVNLMVSTGFFVKISENSLQKLYIYITTQHNTSCYLFYCLLAFWHNKQLNGTSENWKLLHFHKSFFLKQTLNFWLWHIFVALCLFSYK